MRDEARPVVALLALGCEQPSLCASALSEAGCEPAVVQRDDPLPAGVEGLCACGEGPFGLDGEAAPAALIQAIGAGFPVLGIEAGFHALNIALGGRPPVPVPGHTDDSGGDSSAPIAHRIFLALGGKVASAIGGSGFALASGSHTHGVRPREQAPGTLASAYAVADGVIEAIESRGGRWVIGVQWRAHRVGEQPAGFDGLFRALVRQARRR